MLLQGRTTHYKVLHFLCSRRGKLSVKAVEAWVVRESSKGPSSETTDANPRSTRRLKMQSKTLELVYRDKTEGSTKQAINDSSTRAVLRELYLLLEDYAPSWYTEEHHKRALNTILDREI